MMDVKKSTPVMFDNALRSPSTITNEENKLEVSMEEEMEKLLYSDSEEEETDTGSPSNTDISEKETTTTEKVTSDKDEKGRIIEC